MTRTSSESARPVGDPSEDLELSTLVGALDIISRLKRIERSVDILSDAIANLQIMMTAEVLARAHADALRSMPVPLPSVYVPNVYGTFC
jgi:hypothetical protein